MRFPRFFNLGTSVTVTFASVQISLLSHENHACNDSWEYSILTNRVGNFKPAPFVHQRAHWFCNSCVDSTQHHYSRHFSVTNVQQNVSHYNCLHYWPILSEGWHLRRHRRSCARGLMMICGRFRAEVAIGQHLSRKPSSLSRTSSSRISSSSDNALGRFSPKVVRGVYLPHKFVFAVEDLLDIR